MVFKELKQCSKKRIMRSFRQCAMVATEDVTNNDNPGFIRTLIHLQMIYLNADKQTAICAIKEIHIKKI